VNGLSVALIAVVGVFFLGMGVYGLVAPAALVRPFGIALKSPESRSEVRAVYGGFGIAIAGLLAYAALHAEVRTGILAAVAVALVGMAAGRVISAVAGERTGFYPNWFYFLVELGLAGALLLAISL
jgi:hypothetical protein